MSITEVSELSDPVEEVLNGGEHIRAASTRATDRPTDDAGELVPAVGGSTQQRSSAVSLYRRKMNAV